MKILHVSSMSSNVGDRALNHALQSEILRVRPDARFSRMNCFTSFFDVSIAKKVSAEHDLLLLGGGGLLYCPRKFFSAERTLPSGFMWNVTMDALNALSIPIACYALGVNSWRGERLSMPDRARPFVKKLIEKSIDFTVRIDGSRELLSAFIGEEIGSSHDCPDPGSHSRASQEDSLRSPSASRQIICLQLAWDKIESRYGKPLNHGQLPNSVLHMINVLNSVLMKRKNCSAVLVPHRKQDTAGCETFVRQIEDRASVMPFSDDHAHHGKVMDLYDRSDVVIGTRGHSVICPIGRCVPTIGISTYDKILGFMTRIGLSDFCVDPRSPRFSDLLFGCIEKCFREKDIIVKKMKKIDSLLRRWTESTIKRIIDKVDGLRSS